MSAMYPLAIIHTASITSLARMTLYHHVYHAKIETNEGVAALSGGQVERLARRAAARSDGQEQPCVTDGACSDSERTLL